MMIRRMMMMMLLLLLLLTLMMANTCNNTRRRRSHNLGIHMLRHFRRQTLQTRTLTRTLLYSKKQRCQPCNQHCKKSSCTIPLLHVLCQKRTWTTESAAGVNNQLEIMQCCVVRESRAQRQCIETEQIGSVVADDSAKAAAVAQIVF